MEDNIKKAIENYQCPGCVVGCDISCFKPHNGGIGCGKHLAGTMIYPIAGKIFLGLPKGFNRLGSFDSMIPRIYEKCSTDQYDPLNIPAWKYFDAEQGCTIVRGMSPRINKPFLDIFLEDCRDQIKCHEITNDFLEIID